MRLDSLREPGAVRLVELASGIDALYMSGRCNLPAQLVRDLEGWRAEAQATNTPVGIIWLGESFQVLPSGLGRYPFRVDHKNGVLGFSTSASLPAIRVQPKAEHLHAVGPTEVLSWWKDLLDGLTGHAFLGISRLDLFSDWQGWALLANDGPSFVCRATRRDTHENGNEFTGFAFGRRATGTISARIYDKTRQIKEKHSDYWFDVWGERFRPGVQVLRVEFEIGRQGLREFGIDSAASAIASAPRLWASVSDNWLSYRIPATDETRARWPVSEAWRAVQNPSFRGEVIGLERIREAQKAANFRSLMPGAFGYLTSLGALAGTQDIEDTLEILPGHLRDYGVTQQTTFAERIAAKRSRLA